MLEKNFVSKMQYQPRYNQRAAIFVAFPIVIYATIMQTVNSEQLRKGKKKYWHHRQSERIGWITNFHFVLFRRIFMRWLNKIWFRFHKIGLISILTNISVTHVFMSNEISKKLRFLPSYISGIFFLPLFWPSLSDFLFQLIII